MNLAHGLNGVQDRGFYNLLPRCHLETVSEVGEICAMGIFESPGWNNANHLLTSCQQGES